MNNDYYHYKIENAIDFLIDFQLKYNQYKQMVKICFKSLLISSNVLVKDICNLKMRNTSKNLDDNIDCLIDSYYTYVLFFMRNKESPKTVASYLMSLLEKK